jgi:hypothetical protein
LPHPDDTADAAALIERLLLDERFRAEFRRDPAGVCRREGLDAVSDELATSGNAFQTLEVRESKSSLAGVLLAAAAEGIGMVELIHHMQGAGGHHLDPPAQRALTTALSSPRLRAVSPDAAGMSRAAAEPSGPGIAFGRHVEPDGAGDRVGMAQSVASTPPPAAPGAPPLVETSTPSPPPPLVEAASTPPPPAEPAPLIEAASTPTFDPIALAPGAQAEAAAGADPRAMALLRSIVGEHKIEVATLGGENGAPLVITAVDGQPVSSMNVGARDIAEQLAGLDAASRPPEVGTPWQIGAPGFETGPELQNRIEIHLPDPATTPPAGGAPPPDPRADGVSQGRASGVFGTVKPDDAAGPAPGESQGRASGVFGSVEPPKPALPAVQPVPVAGQIPGQVVQQPIPGQVVQQPIPGQIVQPIPGQQLVQQVPGQQVVQQLPVQQVVQQAPGQQGLGQQVAGQVIPGAPALGPGRPDVVAYAMKYLGVPYRWGGESPSGFDCSGLVKYAYAHFGIDMPHYTHSQFAKFPHVDRDQLQPGDIVFFNNVEHEGMYIGGGKFIQAPHTGDVVKISSMDDPYYKSHYSGAVRPY